jgi:hypothetical protein
MERFLKGILAMVILNLSTYYSIVEKQNKNIDISQTQPFQKLPVVSRKISSVSRENRGLLKKLDNILYKIKKTIYLDLKSWYKNEPEFKKLVNLMGLPSFSVALVAVGFLLGQSSKPMETTPIKPYSVGRQSQDLGKVLLNGDDLKPIVKLLIDGYGQVKQTNLPFAITMAKKFSSRLFQRIVTDIKNSGGLKYKLQPLTSSFLSLIDIFDIGLLDQLLKNRGSVNSWYEIIIKPWISTESILKIFKSFESYLTKEIKKIDDLYDELKDLSLEERSNRKKINFEYQCLQSIEQNINRINTKYPNMDMLFLIEQIPNILKFLGVVLGTGSGKAYLTDLLNYGKETIEKLKQAQASELITLAKTVASLGVGDTRLRGLIDHISDKDRFKALVDPIVDAIGEMQNKINDPITEEDQAKINNFIYFFSKYLISFFRNIIKNRKAQCQTFKEQLIISLSDAPDEKRSLQDLLSDDQWVHHVVEKIFTFIDDPNNPENDGVAQQSKEFLTIWSQVFKNLLQVFHQFNQLFDKKIKTQFSRNPL